MTPPLAPRPWPSSSARELSSRLHRRPPPSPRLPHRMAYGDWPGLARRQLASYHQMICFKKILGDVDGAFVSKSREPCENGRSRKRTICRWWTEACPRRLSWHCERGGDYAVAWKSFATPQCFQTSGTTRPKVSCAGSWASSSTVAPCPLSRICFRARQWYMIPRKLLKGDLHLLDLAGVGFQGADSFTTVLSSSTSAKANASQSLVGFCKRRLSWDCERGADYTVPLTVCATSMPSVPVRYQIRR